MLKLSEPENHPHLARRIEKAFALAAKRFPYWQVDLAALTPAIVEIGPEDPRGEVFSFGVTKGLTLMISSRVEEFGWTDGAWATVFVHELMHVWQRHHERFVGLPGYTPEKGNAAADLEINDDLEDAGCEFPRGPDGVRQGLFPEDYGFDRHLTMERYLELINELEKRKPNMPKASNVPTGGSCGGAAGNPSDVEIDLLESGELTGSGDTQEGLSDEAAALARAKGWDKTPEEVEAAMQRMTDALVAAGSEPGKLPAGLALTVERIKASAKVDWRPVVRVAVRQVITTVRGGRFDDWSRLSRRTLGRFFRPSHVEPKVRVVVALDTSGSMVQFLPEMVAELSGICSAARAEVDWILCDAEVAATGKFRHVGEVDKLELKGGGGTDFRPVFAHLAALPKRDQPDILIYVTDGFGSAPANPPPYKVVWAMLGGKRAPVSWGSKVLIEGGA